jgi:RHS repeat-associated protein
MLSFGACTRTAHTATDFDGAPQTSDSHASLANSTDNPPTTYDSGLMKAHLDATGASFPAYARGVFNVNVPDGYNGYAGAAFYFPPGTLSGATPTQKGDLDIYRWDNERTQGAGFDQGGIRISGTDHLARLIRQQGSNAAVTIGQPFRLQEGCWNWIWVHQRLSASTSHDTNTVLSEVSLNGEKVIYSTDPNSYGNGAADIKVGLVNAASAQSGTALDFYVANAMISNSEIVPPRSGACEPLSGARPYYTIDSEDLNDRMSAGVNVANGNLHVQANDLNIGGTGLDLSVGRYYNSQLQAGSQPGASSGSDLGPHWVTDTGPDVHLIPTPDNGAIFHGPSGYVVTFTNYQWWDGTFTTPTGMNATLTKNSSDGTYALKFHRNQLTYKFASDGHLTSIVDQNNNHIDYSYVAPNQLSTITDSQGHSYSFTYDGAGKLTDINGPTGNSDTRNWHYAYSGDNLTSYRDPAGKTTGYGYTSDGKLNLITDPLGNRTTITYSPNTRDRVASIAVKDVAANVTHTTTYNYVQGAACVDTSLTRTNVTDANGHVTRYCSDSQGHVLQVMRANVTTPTGVHDLPQKTSYTTNSDVQDYTSPGAVGAGAAANMTFHYNQNDSPDRATARTGTASDPGSYDTTFTYAAPPQGSPKSDFHNFYPQDTTGPLGDTTHFVYDANGNTTRAYDDWGDVNLTYNSNGTTATSTDGNGHATSYGYTGGNLTSVTPPAPLGAEAFTYDGINRIKTATDGKNQTTSYTYDTLDRVATVTFQDGSLTSYTYDDNGNLLTATDHPAGSGTSVTTDSYDGFNQLVQEVLPQANGRTNQYGYDKVGNLTQTLDDDGEWITYRYDEANRMTSIEEPFVENVVGNCSSATSTPCTRFEYDDNGNLTKTSYPSASYPGGVVTQTATYYDEDKVKHIEAKGPTGATLTSFDYTYRFPSTLSFSDNSSRGNCFPTSGSPSLNSGLIRSVTDKDGKKTVYCYDTRGRVGAVDEIPSGGTDNVTQLYYDAANNLTREDPGTSTYYNYNNANELTGSGPNQSSPDATYSYDANGNMTSKSLNGTQTLGLAYNALDQTSSITPSAGASAVPLGYNGPSQIDPATEGSATITNTVLGLTMREDPNALNFYMRDKQGGLVTRRPGANDDPAATYNYLFDGQGNVVALTDPQGQVVRANKFDVFGKTTSSGTVSDYFGYGQGYQAPGGLLRFGFRYYDPASRRWTQQDPIVAPGDLLGQNRYTYVGDDPVNGVDPAGDCFILSCNTYHKIGGVLLGAGALGVRQSLGGSPSRGSVRAAVGCFTFVALSRFTRGLNARLGVARYFRGPGGPSSCLAGASRFH